MDMSFYVATLGARASQKKLDVTSNNLANINNYGFKPRETAFTELVNYNLNDSRDASTNLQAGAGVAVSSTRVSFRAEGAHETGGEYDYALTTDNTFFKLRDPSNGNITYARNGEFHRSVMDNGDIFLATNSGKFVLDEDDMPIQLNEEDPLVVQSGAEVQERIGIFTFPHPTRLDNVGDNELVLREGDLENQPVLAEDKSTMHGYLESSGTDLAREMTNVIKAQRNMQMALRMVTTSDEVEQTVNQLRS